MENLKFGKLCKDRMVTEILDEIKAHPNFIITSYMGSSVADLESVRKSLRPTAGSYMVVKNSIFRVICDQLKLSDVKPLIDGGIGISFGGNDAVAACKAVVDFAKTHEKFVIKGAMIDGAFMNVDRVKALANLPPRQVLLTRVVVGMKSPITGLVFTLNGVLRKFVCVVDAIKESKQRTPESAASPSA